MSEIVVIGQSNDAPRVRKVVEALHAQGLDLWWETDAPASPQATAYLDNARCVVVFVSRAALSDPAYLVMADKAFSEGKAIGARLDRSAVPASLSGMTLIDLSRFKKNKNDLFLLDLLAAARAKAAGIDPPPQKGPLKRIWTRITLSIPVILLVLGIAANIEQFKSYLSFGTSYVVAQFQPEKKKEWQAIPLGKPGACEALEAFKNKYGEDGFYHPQAESLLNNARTENRLEWVVGAQKGLPLLVQGSSQSPTSSKAVAEAQALKDAKSGADETCRQSFAEVGGGRFLRTEIVPGSEVYDCTQTSEGYRCQLKLKFDCHFEDRTQTTVRICGKPS